MVRVVKAAGGAKAPLVHSEALGWLQGCVEDFGAASVPAVDLVAFVASELEHVNPKACSVEMSDAEHREWWILFHHILLFIPGA